MNHIRNYLFVLLIILALLLSTGGRPAAAGEGRPGEPDDFPESLRLDREPRQRQQAPSGGVPQTISSPEAAGATGGPDWYGYTWDDSVPLNWIDAASGGTDVGLGPANSYELSAPISLPFPFRFYEEVYTEIWVAPYGYLTFIDDYYINEQQNPFPDIGRPNNLIAPFWTIIALANSGPNGRVYYQSGGTAPNRYFAVEWHNVAGGTESDPSAGDELYRFEAVLYENGDIFFQYHTMTYNDWRYYASAGIEDPYGAGLGYMDWSPYQEIPSGKAIRFQYPAPAARVNVTPNYFGSFTYAGAVNEFQVPVRNTGELGADTYDIFVSSSWPAHLFAADGTTPLSDSDTDGTVDTGSVAQGATSQVVVKVDVPSGAVVGNANITTLSVNSSLNPAKTKNASLASTIPTAFAQVFQDSDDGDVSIYLAQPGGQAIKTAADAVYSGESAIAEAPNGNFLAVWNDFRSLSSGAGSIGITELYYALLNRYGDVIRPPTRLADLSGVQYSTRDYEPAIAVTPDGHMGVLWYRYQYNSATDELNYNIYLTTLDANGAWVSGPTNVTNNAMWGTWDVPNLPRYWSPRIAATTDSRFVLSWQKYIYDGSDYLYDIEYAVYNASGGVVKAPMQLTNAAQSGIYYSPSTVATLTNNRVILLYEGDSLFYVIMDSSGSIIKPDTNLGDDAYYADAVQLAGGNILVAWSYWVNNPQITYALLSGSSYDLVYGPSALSNPAALLGDTAVSATEDASGRGVLTWMDADWGFEHNLYYALIDANGSVLTQPVIFRSSQQQGLYDYIISSYSGYGNTSYSWTPPPVDLSLSTAGALSGGQPGGGAPVGITYANHGAGDASDVVITATLGISLTYLSDSSGVTPSAAGNQLVWQMPDLSFLERRQFMLYVGVPANAALGDRFPVQVQATCAGVDADPADNSDSLEIMVSRQVYLPLLSR